MSMHVHKLREGLWRWACPHPEWNGATDWDEVVGSVYCETSQAIVLIDPLVPDGDDAVRFWRALDRDVELLALPVVVLLTCRWHVRSTPAVRDRYDARVLAPVVDGHGFAGVVTDPIRDGEEIVPGVVALVAGFPAPNEECVYVLPDHKTAVVGDVLQTADAAPVLAPAAWYDNSDAERDWYRTGLPTFLERIAAYEIETLLVGHGEPVESGAAARLLRLVRP